MPMPEFYITDIKCVGNNVRVAGVTYNGYDLIEITNAKPYENDRIRVTINEAKQIIEALQNAVAGMERTQ